MWYVLRTLTDYLRLDFNNNLRALTSALGTMNKIRARYTQIVERLPKMELAEKGANCESYRVETRRKRNLGTGFL